jgi:NAD(P)-dependent dehydrogenase (short-subunit alcohol dehydrogenase family)
LEERRIMPTAITLITGANRGLGLETARQLAQRGHAVLLGCRDREKGERAAERLRREQFDATALLLDVASDESIAAARAEVERTRGRLDVLINNAAIHYDDSQRAASADLRLAREALATNAIGAWSVAIAFVPLLRKSAHGRLVNVSSESGSLAGMGGTAPAYSMSKAALNALTRQLAADLARDRILVNSVCPGWVATDMGGAGGRPIPEGAASIVWAATLPDGGPTGGFFRDGEALPW